MKKILVNISIILISIIMLSGCGKSYEKLSYTRYNEYFNNKNDYVTIDHSSDRGTEIIRDLEAGNGTIKVMYLEFKTEESASSYIKEMYKKSDGYKYKINDDTTFIQNKNGMYFKLYKIDNIILYAISLEKNDKHEINKILKDLGY